MNVSYTLENDMYKYVYGNCNRWEAPFDCQKNRELSCAANDRAALQLLLFSDEDVCCTVQTSPALHKVWPRPVLRLSAFLPDYPGVSVSLAFVEGVRDDDGNYKSEVLLSSPSIETDRLRVQPVWIEFVTKKDTPPGTVVCTVSIFETRLFGDEVLLGTANIKLEILPVTLPFLYESPFRLDLWQHHTSIARTYQVPLWSDRHFTLMERYLTTLEELGQGACTLIVSEAPWSGQWSAWYRTNPSDSHEYNMIHAKKDISGKWRYDFTALDRYVMLCFDHHINREIEIFGLLGVWTMPDAGLSRPDAGCLDAVRVRYTDEADGRLCYMRSQEELDNYIREIDRHFCEKGWDGIARIACDEPDNPGLFQSQLSRIQELAPHLSLKVTLCSPNLMEAPCEGISDYVLNLPLIMENPEQFSTLSQNSEIRLSYYTAIRPEHPNTFLCCHPAEARFLPWLSLLLHMDGFLRWAAWLWPDNPFDMDSYHFQKFKSGGTHFLYPGRDGRPLYSLRYKQLQKGLRDYLILTLWGEKCNPARPGASLDAAEGLLKAPLSKLLDSSAVELFQTDYERFEAITGRLLKELCAQVSAAGKEPS